MIQRDDSFDNFLIFFAMAIISTQVEFVFFFLKDNLQHILYNFLLFLILHNLTNNYYLNIMVVLKFQNFYLNIFYKIKNFFFVFFKLINS